MTHITTTRFLFLLIIGMGYLKAMDTKPSPTLRDAFTCARVKIQKAADLKGEMADAALDGALSPLVHASRPSDIYGKSTELQAFYQIWPMLNTITVAKLQSRTITVASFVKSSFEKTIVEQKKVEEIVAAILKKAGCSDYKDIRMYALNSKNKAKLITQIYVQVEDIFNHLSNVKNKSS